MTELSVADLQKRVYAAGHVPQIGAGMSPSAGGDDWFDIFAVLADPYLLSEIAEAMVPLVPTDAQALAGPELGGVPVVTALSRVTGLPSAWVRRTPKRYGDTTRLVEGAMVRGSHVVLIEPKVKSGRYAANLCAELRAIGAEVTHCLSVIDWERGGRDLLGAQGVDLRSLFTYAAVARVGRQG